MNNFKRRRTKKFHIVKKLQDHFQLVHVEEHTSCVNCNEELWSVHSPMSCSIKYGNAMISRDCEFTVTSGFVVLINSVIIQNCIKRQNQFIITRRVIKHTVIREVLSLLFPYFMNILPVCSSSFLLNIFGENLSLISINLLNDIFNQFNKQLD